uniref:Uncharacterized protein n=1 Tax=Arion vulgaris TaxID=1028688 RepID=A0A0B7BA98_9EUPU
MSHYFPTSYDTRDINCPKLTVYESSHHNLAVPLTSTTLNQHNFKPRCLPF